MKGYRYFIFILFIFPVFAVRSQVPANINTGNPNYPFPQFLGYTGGIENLAHKNPVGVTHAEMEQRIRDAYKILCNNMTYNVGANFAPVTVAGVKYIAPNHTPSNDIGHCHCVEGDGYYLLAAAYMADKATFDGYYMYIHDRQFQEATRFVDCVTNPPYTFGNPGLSGAGDKFNNNWTLTSVNGGGIYGGAALDGNEDVALALLMAWKQWGDNGVICINPCDGTPVTYKNEAIKFIKAMVEPVPTPWGTHKPGVIGFDGYRKDGDVTKEITTWANGGYMGYTPLNPGPAYCGTACDGGYNTYVDYAAPAYFRSFGDMLQAEGLPAFLVNQFRRGEASDDWTIGQAYAQGLIPWAGVVGIDENTKTASFKSFVDGEDFRYGWRTILNYLWNGAPQLTWDPVTHQAVPGTNTYEYDMALRFANFLKNPHAYHASNSPEVMEGLPYCGTPLVLAQYNPDGSKAPAPGPPPARFYPINWAHGTGAPAAVVSQDFDLMAEMVRECVVKWDPSNQDKTTPAVQKYLDGMPGYFHEWFRLLGMLVLTGNHHDPMDILEGENISSKANMKVYKAVDKTYAYEGDILTYTISYRNYSKTSAANVVITDNLPAGLAFVSASNGGTAAGSTVTWNIGAVPGFVTNGLSSTMGSVTLQVRVTAAATGRLCNSATISCSNGYGWISNEYPNNITDVMERNCVDILTEKPLSIRKRASKPVVMVGDTISYTIVVKNNPVPFLNGGRPGVKITSAHSGLTNHPSILTLKYRVFQAAHEPVINYRNYRVSYYMKKPGPPAYSYTLIYNQGCTPAPTYSSQVLPVGATWNHRVMLNFPDQKAQPYLHLEWYNNQPMYIHEGAVAPQRVVYDINAGVAVDYTTDWSAEPAASMAAVSPYYPIGNDWTDPANPDLPVTTHHPGYCNGTVAALTRQLVEEWDGYTWRRAYGNAPVTGRELTNIIVKDILPDHVSFVNYFTGYPTGTLAGNVITWPTIAQLNIGDSIVYKFWVRVNDASYFGCPDDPDPSEFENKATAEADREPMARDSVKTQVSCTPVTITSPSMTKTADKAVYGSGESITYTITYTNLDGTVVQGNMTTADWNIREGGNNIVLNNPTEISLVSTTWNTRSWTHRYSHGTNGTIRGTFSIPIDRTYRIIARHNGTSWIEFYFRPQTGNNVQVRVFSMPGDVEIGSAQTVPFATAASTSFDFQIQLVNGAANIWVAVPNAVLPGSPTFSFTGLPVHAGYAGVKTTTGDAGARISNWYTHLDSGFLLQMTDPIPSQITFVSAANALHNGNNYSGSNLAGTVTWQTISGPVLANEVIVYSWSGTVSTCASQIKNTAYAKILGVTPDPAGEVFVSCDGTTPVELLSFSGFSSGENALLFWSTAWEKDNRNFIVERSFDGKNYYQIGLVQGKGNSQSVSQYDFTDHNVPSVQAYYRLTQVDYNGTRTYSNIIIVTFELTVNAEIYPNPFSDQIYIKLVIPDGEEVSISVFSVEGVEIFSSGKLSTSQILNFGSEFPVGIYFLHLSSKDNTRIYKVHKM
ncbi:MAG: T9SS type A sorting domain-containing protein [Cytophagaceae bacterium]